MIKWVIYIMKNLNTTNIFFLIVMLLLPVSHQTYALTLTSSEHYYLVTPKNEKDVQQAIYNSSPMQGDHNNSRNHKYVGMHKASYTNPSYTLKYNDKLCFIDNINLHFDSKIYLPKLDLDMGRYTDKTMMKFESELYEIRTHEFKHREIFINHLQNALIDLRSINKNNSQFKECSSLKTYIQKVIDDTQSIIIQKNLDFDCYEYGNKMDIPACKSATTQHQKVKVGSFSSVIQDENPKNSVASYKEKPENDDCEGKLIEPFKGKFYCVPEDLYSEQ